jgi:hypothetical protein
VFITILSNIYRAPRSSPTYNDDFFAVELHQIVQFSNDGFEIILAGDFNSRVGDVHSWGRSFVSAELLDCVVPEESVDHKVTPTGIELSYFARDLDLFLVQATGDNNTIAVPTHRNGNAVLDFFYVSFNLKVLVSNCTIAPGYLSDHGIVVHHIATSGNPGQGAAVTSGVPVRRFKVDYSKLDEVYFSESFLEACTDGRNLDSVEILNLINDFVFVPLSNMMKPALKLKIKNALALSGLSRRAIWCFVR